MKAQYHSMGCMVDYTPTVAVSAGEVVVTNGRVRIAITAIAANVLGALCTGGLFTVAKDASNVADGNALYWDADGDPVGGTAGSGAFTSTSAGNTFAGYAMAAAGTTVGTVPMLLIQPPATLTINGPLETLVADPGNAGAIPVITSGHVEIVTAGAETRTLAAPSFLGQQMLISLKTDGGDCVITCATTVNQTGNNTITHNDAGDALLLVAKQNGANRRWSVVSNDGAALSTV